jgi:hypothetical protein
VGDPVLRSMGMRVGGFAAMMVLVLAAVLV